MKKYSREGIYFKAVDTREIHIKSRRIHNICYKLAVMAVQPESGRASEHCIASRTIRAQKARVAAGARKAFFNAIIICEQVALII